jgi:dimethylhistidine N-methyltransferase
MSIIGVSKTDITEEFVTDLKLGFMNNPKSISPKYLYDEEGSRLFEEICKQPEYYPTRTESSIIERYVDDILAYDDKISLIELGSGSSNKTRFFINHLLNKQNELYYMPIDISYSALQDAIDNLSKNYNNLNAIGITADYIEGIKIANRIIKKDKIDTSKLILFLGSSIGNLESEDAERFLKLLSNNMSYRDRLLIGFDLKKDIKILEGAYNDEKGVTAQFNLNLLRRINRELGGKFIIDNFMHNAHYNEQHSRIEMHIISRIEQDVYIDALKGYVRFAKDESIHTENSYKFSIDDIDGLMNKTSLKIEKHYTDDNRWFDLVLISKD